MPLTTIAVAAAPSIPRLINTQDRGMEHARDSEERLLDHDAGQDGLVEDPVHTEHLQRGDQVVPPLDMKPGKVDVDAMIRRLASELDEEGVV
jgi:hypothetical protein